MQAMEADPVRDMAHPEGIGVEIRHKSCRGMQLMLYVNLAKQTGRAQLSCLPGTYNISIYCTAQCVHCTVFFPLDRARSDLS